MKSKDRSFYMAWQLVLVLTFAVAGAGKQTQPAGGTDAGAHFRLGHL